MIFLLHSRAILFIFLTLLTTVFSHFLSQLIEVIKYTNTDETWRKPTNPAHKKSTVKWDNSAGAIKICSLIMNEQCVGVISIANTMTFYTVFASLYELVSIWKEKEKTPHYTFSMKQ